ncbi:fumarylacetoacetate hydrolase, putative [Talaromyces stipitatus ATCC 10500]|uniref:Fumarylacetoacetate hydrolase, putative n=1 Tax=Talaromyces stipitatus (strain ATCC 10500 / CBS 375.48 / QM 6759 / NRRL 1006) TaxID=441959 RepID=B8MAU5_TALSN|nr:fumarylacetoacetate hydrolase, putative [Talaromyces stipitatus ATCC 10500]EED17785.1 fumarylacetoacetate hydrolase, putative [Talaromyces stipitatus ATCC 10500]
MAEAFGVFKSSLTMEPHSYVCVDYKSKFRHGGRYDSYPSLISVLATPATSPTMIMDSDQLQLEEFIAGTRINMPFNYCAYIDFSGEHRIGHLDLNSNKIQPLSLVSGTCLSNLYEVIEAGEINITISREDQISLSDVKLLPPISGRDILAVGKNYPTLPVIFTKCATSIVAHGESVLLHPGFTETPDYEGEVGVIIGKAGHKIPESEAMDYVWGYTIINDFTARERQRDHKQFFIGKSPDTYCPIGPVAVPKEYLPTNLRLQTFVNGEKRQDATIDQLIFSVPHLISCLSQAQTLQPGDTIATGTPYGVGFGFRPMKFLKAGDEVKVSITGLGTLTNRIAAADAVNPTVDLVKAQSPIPISNQKARGHNGLLKVGNKELFYQFLGQRDGPQTIFIHGLGGSSTYFSPLYKKLQATHGLHLIDLEGQGLSPTSALSNLTIESFASDIHDIYKSVRPDSKPATIIAHSMGCLVAVKFALENTSLVSSLVLMGPSPSPLSQASSIAIFARAESVPNKGMLAVVDTMVNTDLSIETKTDNPLAVAATRMSLLGQDPEGFAKACMALARSAEEILDIAQLPASCKTLIIAGLEDEFSTPDVCSDYGKRIKSSEVKVLDGVAQWHLFEDVKGTSDAIYSFLGVP